MARRINRLSPADLRTKQPGLHPDGGGLYLQVTAAQDGTLSRSWIFRFAVGGRERKHGLGSLKDVGLAEARDAASKCRLMRREHVDPIERRAADRADRHLAAAKSITFDKAADRYVAAHRAGWRAAKHVMQWRKTLADYAGPVFGKLPVGAIDTSLVMQVLEPIWSTKPETAGRVRGRIEAVLDWAQARGFREAQNPARWKGHLSKLLPARSKVRKVRHHPALPYAEVGSFMAALRSQEGTGARALEFAILTAARTGETIGAKWSEIDFVDATWTVPAERMKGGQREHRVPLGLGALSILQRMHALRQNEFVFPGDRPGKPISNMAMLQLLERMGRGDITVHGFRSTFRDWAAERTSFPREVVEAALAHAVGDKVEAAYRRGDLFEKRRKLMSAWEVACARPARAASVVPLQRAAHA
jgi:integrase